MKTLFVLRHAKSSWNDAGLSDFDRPLNERGLKAAPLMGEVMKKNQFQPALILSSPAKRAEQTANLVKEAAGIGSAIQYEKRIYEASVPRLLEIISEQDEKIESILLVGHNPGFEGLLRFLTGEMHEIPTATLAVIDLKAQKWNEINYATGNLRALIRPKEVEL
jgi:phosphohistidine phosphatase